MDYEHPQGGDSSRPPRGSSILASEALLMDPLYRPLRREQGMEISWRECLRWVSRYPPGDLFEDEKDEDENKIL
jgi:hypothetical protein